MRKKSLFLIGALVFASIISIILVYNHHHRNQQHIQNVFDEILYAETSAFQTNTFFMNILRNEGPLRLIENIDNSRMGYPLESDGTFIVEIAYNKNLPEEVKDLRFTFYPDADLPEDVVMNIEMEIQLPETDNQYVWVGCRYFPEEA